MQDAGNDYQLEELHPGIMTFRHKATGELLHGSVGPEKEARELYLASSGLLQCSAETCVVFDVGLGCGAQLFALLNFMFSPNAQCRTLRIFSFDLEKEGLRAILKNAQHFSYIMPHIEFLARACKSDEVSFTTPEQRSIVWTFVPGDFRETVLQPQLKDSSLKVDAIFYDFFSPASHPWLWTLELFSKLHGYAHSRTRLVTYSSATCVKAALAGAGWFVGQTIASGKKSKSILAAGSVSELEDPLPSSFLSTFERSDKRFSAAETDECKEKIIKNLRNHPQFNK